MDEKYKSMIKVINPDPLMVLQYEEISSEEFFSYEVKGTLSEDCRKQIRSLGIADELGIEKERKSLFWFTLHSLFK